MVKQNKRKKNRNYKIKATHTPKYTQQMENNTKNDRIFMKFDKMGNAILYIYI